ncbi:hypothetical protein H0A61_01403 [Koleobacter methoxysyntrophicus]|jgi:molybdopterin synthase sulfur carrier subunit|uniref:MoaD family protein n=2 Tax=Koleobacter methoxysyntrophicus TaxID=2751313 RepID=A0A8A0RPA8_9FIRM|nr:hypothetical protein H0A61_01403 [Koleobacter methoxysyntrophicus]
MDMKVKFFAYIRDYTNSREIEFGYCKTVRELLQRLCKKYGQKFKDRVFKGEELSGEVLILVNGRDIVHLNHLNTTLNEDDEICIFPVIAGG